MYAREAFTQIRALDDEVERQVVRRREILLLGGGRVRIGDHELGIGSRCHDELRKRFRFPASLEKRLDTDVARSVWSNLNRSDLCAEHGKRALPKEVRIFVVAGQLVGFADAELVTLRNKHVIESLESFEGAAVDFSTARVHHFAPAHISVDFSVTFPVFQAKPRVGDIVEGGLAVSHSGTGTFPTMVRHYLHRLVCSNGMLMPVCVGEQRIRIRRLAKSQFAQQDVIDRLSEVLRVAFGQLAAKLQAVEQLASRKVDSRSMIEQIVIEHRLSRKVGEQLVHALATDEAGTSGESVFDVINALSRVATHGPVGEVNDGEIPASVRQRLQLLSGVLAQQSAHLCSQCKRLLHPSRN